MIKILWLTGLLLLVPALGRAEPVVSRSSYESASCPPRVVPDQGIECGVLSVPENRDRVGSRLIELPVLIFHSRSASPAKDPIVFLNGGPGNSNVAGPRSANTNPFSDERDHIFLEARGAQLASSSLDCPEFTAAKQAVAEDAPNGKGGDLIHSAASCRARLVAMGVDLDGYTSAAAADDLEELRRAMKLDKLNLYGLSYGTRLALTMARRHPDSVRSMVLDSVLPPDVNYDEMFADSFWRALRAVFDACALDPLCRSDHPRLAREFTDLVVRADEKPIVIASATQREAQLTASGAQIVDAIGAVLHDPKAIPSLPKLIGEAAAGRYGELAPFVKAGMAPSTYAWGLRLSVWCAEEMPFETEARMRTQLAKSAGLGGNDGRTTSPAVCRVWDVKAVLPVENEAVRSNTPTLILSGEFDPDTPPEWGRRLLKSMPNATLVEMTGRSHGASFDACGGSLALAFFHDPKGPLPVACALKEPRASFVR